ncbi:MAG: protein TolR [Thermodesulfobacteriota bacterium]
MHPVEEMRKIASRTNTKALLSQINVTSLVDVMLVLLIIFMVTAPMMQEGIDVNLPKVRAGAITSDEEPLIISINKKGHLFIEKKKVTVKELGKKLNTILKRRKEKMVLLMADAEVPYGHVIKAMAEIRNAGVDKVGMVTEPLDAKMK